MLSVLCLLCLGGMRIRILPFSFWDYINDLLKSSGSVAVFRYFLFCYVIVHLAPVMLKHCNTLMLMSVKQLMLSCVFSAGIGRTGTVIVIDMILNQIQRLGNTLVPYIWIRIYRLMSSGLLDGPLPVMVRDHPVMTFTRKSGFWPPPLCPHAHMHPPQPVPPPPFTCVDIVKKIKWSSDSCKASCPTTNMLLSPTSSVCCIHFLLNSE